MTVRELIEALQKEPNQDAEVVVRIEEPEECYCGGDPDFSIESPYIVGYTMDTLAQNDINRSDSKAGPWLLLDWG